MSDPEIVDRMGGGKKLPTLKSCCYVRKPLHHPPVQSLNDFLSRCTRFQCDSCISFSGKVILGK